MFTEQVLLVQRRGGINKSYAPSLLHGSLALVAYFCSFWCSVGGVIFSQGCILSWPCAFVGKKSKEGMESSSFVLILDLIKGEKSESL